MGFTCFFFLFFLPPPWLFSHQQSPPQTPQTPCHLLPGFFTLSTPFLFLLLSSPISLALNPDDHCCRFCIAAIGCWACWVDAVVVWVVWVVLVVVGCRGGGGWMSWWWWLDVVVGGWMSLLWEFIWMTQPLLSRFGTYLTRWCVIPATMA
jgi:hypothetical protein